MADSRSSLARDPAQVQPASAAPAAPAAPLEFQETTSVTLEWKLTGLKAMYDSTKGETKSKCIKSAAFGDVDNLWEVLWYPNSGAAGGEYASLYLSCVEREAAVNGKWARKGLWWFRFEIRAHDERTARAVVLATKDASDHTFAVKTANWGWQQFSRRDALFLAPAALAADAFTVSCTIQAQPQPPAGFWLGVGSGLPRDAAAPVGANLGAKGGGSGGGLSAWAGGEGASGGVAGGTTAAGGVKRVVPRDLMTSVGELLDDPLYSDIEFVIPSRRRDGTAARRIYANKRLLERCAYFEAMFSGGFLEADGTNDYDDIEDEAFDLSDSDEEEESAAETGAATTTTRNPSPAAVRRLSTTADGDVHDKAGDDDDDDDGGAHEGGGRASDGASAEAGGAGGAGHADDQPDEPADEVVAKKPVPPVRTASGDAHALVGPKKTRVLIRDAAWSTWWAVLYWLYTDTIFFAPLTSSFTHDSARRHARSASATSVPGAPEPRTRREWIAAWMAERNVADPSSPGYYGTDAAPGPRPVSAKAVYRLADKLDLPALKLRAFHHICAGLAPPNIPAEVFSRFSSTFEDVRRVQIAFFLRHWAEIKKSDTMQNIWGQIRNGKHVGFEEVWPLIVSQLDFKPS